MRPTNAAPVWSSRVIGIVVLVAVVAIVQFGLAVAAARRPSDALVLVVAVAAVVAIFAFPRVVLVAALLATALPQRVGPAALNMSVTDAVGILGLIAAVRFVPWHDRRLRLIFGALVIYLGTIAVSLVAHHPQKAVFEWFHRGVLFGGAVLIGVAIVRSGSARTALRLFTVLTAAMAANAVAVALTNGFQPAYVFQLQKNHAGLLLAAGFVVVYAAAPTLALPSKLIIGLRVLMVLGLLATQSRAAALGLVAAVALRPLLLGRRGTSRRASWALLALSVALVAVSAISVNANDLSRPADERQFNSIDSRVNVYDQAIQEVWLKNRFLGGGLRYFTEPGFVAPHNLVVSEMAEAGLFGLGGLLVLLTGTVLALRRSASTFAVLGMMALVLRVTQGLADIFWVAGPLTVALILVGMGLADEPGSTETTPDRDVEQSRRPSNLLGSRRRA